MIVYVMQAEHPWIAGEILSVHSTREAADCAALSVVNVMRVDCGLEALSLPPDWRTGLEEVQASDEHDAAPIVSAALTSATLTIQ